MRIYLALMLLVATSVAQSDKKTGTEHAGGAAKTQAKKPAVSVHKQAAQAKSKAPQDGTAEAESQSKKPEAQADAAQAQPEAAQTEVAQAQTEKDPKLTPVPGANALGMSILGNQEAPTSLVIVPWKTSEVGRSPGISPMLDDSRSPVDKEVFMRELRYYEIRSEKKP